MKVQSIDHIYDFETISYEDQIKVMKKINPNFQYGEIAHERTKADNKYALKNYGVEKMTINRGNCFTCKKSLNQGDVIAMRIVFDSKVASEYGRDIKWNHVKCFAEKRSLLGFRSSGSSLTGFKQLNAADQKTVEDLLP